MSNSVVFKNFDDLITQAPALKEYEMLYPRARIIGGPFCPS